MGRGNRPPPPQATTRSGVFGSPPLGSPAPLPPTATSGGLPGATTSGKGFVLESPVRSTTRDESRVLPIFLSFSKPVFPAQQEFIRNLSEGLKSSGMNPRTLGVTVYDIGVPLNAIKDLMNNSLGLISVAFRRTHIETGEKFDDSDGRAGRKEPIRDKWLTSPWPHIEAGMAFQIDLPVLILRESGVVADGILEKGSSAFYLPTFDLDSSAQSYLFSDEWQHIYHKWSHQVKELAQTKAVATTTNELPPTWNFLRKDERFKERDVIIIRKTEDDRDRNFGRPLREDRQQPGIMIRRDEGRDDDVVYIDRVVETTSMGN